MAAELMTFVTGAEKEGKARMTEVVNLMKKELELVKAEEQFAAKWYIRASEKISNGTEEWLEKERKRLNNILAKASLAPEKLEEIKIKANILAAFVTKKAEEAKEKVEQKIKEEL
ncbi:hypothetical protein FRC18_005625 [Serendipita sp. 400]|nr:hypothetical protein FRC18_005625 [Serendipita sp. 400]